MIRMLFLCLGLAAASGVSVATADQEVKHGDWAGGANDLLGATKVDLETPGDSNPHKISMACTDENGTRLKSSDAGYEECIRRASQAQKIQTGN